MSSNALAWKSNKSILPFAKDAILVIVSSFCIGLLGQIAIPLPFTPVPIVIQLQAIFLLSLFIGSRRSAAAVLAFLVQGAVGFPVFANGSGGLLTLIGPTGGYLFGYLVAAYVVGAMIERSKERTVKRAFFAITAGNLIVYFLGASYLSSFVGLQKAMLLGIAPFVAGDLLKNIACLKILKWLKWESRFIG